MMKKCTYKNLVLFVLMIGLMITMTSAHAAVTRIKDIVDVESIRDNQLIGYGLVVGLNGTGDSLGNSPFTQQSLIGMLERLGVNVRDQNLNTGNVAAVMVTATLPPFTNQGSRIDVNIAAMGDAASLRGGTLIVTPLMAADGEVYAVAQGPIAIAGFTVEGDGGSVTQNIPTTGRIASGAIVEREIPYTLAEQNVLRLALRNPDFTTSRRISQAINAYLGTAVAVSDNAASITLTKPGEFDGSIVDLITDIENLQVQPDQIARVVIDEHSGIVVMGSQVRVSPVAIAQANLTVQIIEEPEVSQPNAFSRTGDTVEVPRTNIDINTGDDVQLAVLDNAVTLQDLVTGLNALGVSPRDMITILQAIKRAGALQAEIELM